MAQVITTLSPPSTVEAFVRTYIVTDADGSLRVNEQALTTWLAEQFSYLNGTGSYDTPTSKQAMAASIAQQLAAVVNRENWVGNRFYPNPGGNQADDVRQRLVDLKNQLTAEAHVLEAPYLDFQSGLAARAKAIFTSVVAPSFPSGVARLEVTRTYVETFVTDRGEESRPSDAAVLATLDQNDTANVFCSAAPSGRNIAYRRLYRSATGTQSSAFKLQGEYPASQTTILDEKPDVQLNEVCPTFGWLEPPADLQGLIGMPNGMMLGFVNRTLYACEPYKPYAFPAKYDKPLNHMIVGLVAVGQSAFVGTTGRPYLVSGSDSASLSEEIIGSDAPCLSARSMVAIQNSVFYASKDGLALYENGNVVIVTKGIMDRKKWRTYNPSTMRAGEYDGMYIVFFTKTDSSRGALVFDYENKTMAEMDQAADAVFSNESGIYLLNGTDILDCMPATSINRTGAWYSKTFRLARPQAFAWIHVDSSFLNNGTAVSATVRVYANNVLHHTATISSDAPVRNKPGRARDWRVEIESSAVIDGVVLASTTEELKQAI